MAVHGDSQPAGCSHQCRRRWNRSRVVDDEPGEGEGAGELGADLQKGEKGGDGGGEVGVSCGVGGWRLAVGGGETLMLSWWFCGFEVEEVRFGVADALMRTGVPPGFRLGCASADLMDAAACVGLLG